MKSDRGGWVCVWLCRHRLTGHPYLGSDVAGSVIILRRGDRIDSTYGGRLSHPRLLARTTTCFYSIDCPLLPPPLCPGPQGREESENLERFIDRCRVESNRVMAMCFDA